MIFKQHESKRSNMQSANLSDLLARYGGEKHMHAPDNFKAATKTKTTDILNPLSSSTQNPVQQPDTETTGLIGIRSKYNEDLLLGTHT